MADADREFRIFLEQRFHIVEIPKDGNCMYTSIARGIGPADQTQARVRRDVYSQIVNNYGTYEHLFPGENDGEKLLAVGRILGDGVWGDQASLQAASEAYQWNIAVFLPPRQELIHPQDQRHGRTLYLSYHNGNHYNLLIERTGDNHELRHQEVLLQLRRDATGEEAKKDIKDPSGENCEPSNVLCAQCSNRNKCPKCNKAFKSRSALARHLQLKSCQNECNVCARKIRRCD